MRIEEYFGVLLSNRTPGEQKRYALRKLKRAASFGVLPKKVYEIRVTERDPEKYGAVHIFLVPSKDNKIFCPTNIYFQVTAEITGDLSCDVTVKMYRDYECVQEVTYSQRDPREILRQLKDLRRRAQRKVDSAIAAAPKVNASVPELLQSLMREIYGQRYGFIVDCYNVDINVSLNTEDLSKSGVEVRVIPVSKVIKGALTYIEVEHGTNKISWYPEDTMERFVQEFGKITNGYVVLEQKETISGSECWAYNEDYGFWRYRFDAYYENGQRRVYRTRYDPSKCDAVGDPPVVLFRIVKVTEKSAWLVPVRDPVNFLLKKCKQEIMRR